MYLSPVKVSTTSQLLFPKPSLIDILSLKLIPRFSLFWKNLQKANTRDRVLIIDRGCDSINRRENDIDLSSGRKLRWSAAWEALDFELQL
jgi:hypothetical protein